ncbi:MAG: thioredoxin-disulfide reductase [Campylobacteraceae bacterium]|nr:thioredoxin-disulfide reductase [Campylobacteraceae bacterium]
MLDLAIVGGGPAGLTAGMYATRGGLQNVVMYEKGVIGGQITKSSEIENYPGITQVVSGLELMEKWPEQVMRFGLKYEMAEVVRISKGSDNLFDISIEGDKNVKAKSVIVCTGSNPKKSGVEGEDEFYGKGVSFCATCDGFFYKNKEVAILGGGDAALEEALFLTNICSKVYIVHRRDEFRASPATVQRVKKNNKIELVLNSTVKKIYGDISGVNGLIIDKNGDERDLKVPGVFVFVGMKVNNEVLLQKDGNFLCEMSKNGEVIADLNMKTSLRGLFAAGDIRIDAAKQVICAAGDGATAAINAINYLEGLHE